MTAMKYLLYCLGLFLTIQISSFSQGVTFEKGRIITKENDTLNGYVEMSVTYWEKVSYKPDINAIENQIKIDHIKSLLTPYNQFENVVIEKKEYLFRLAVAGKYSLLQYVEINSGPSYNANGGTMSLNSAPTIIYALRTSNADYILKKKKDKELILPLLNNCLEIKKNVEQKSFNLEDLEEVVKQMNKCN
jgi:hypothetical protein